MLQSNSFDLMAWAPKNWCFQIGVLEKTHENPFQLQRDQTSQSSRKSTLNIHWKDWCWSWSSNIWPPDVKSRLIGRYHDTGKDWGQEQKGATVGEMAGCYHWQEFEQTWETMKNKEAWHAAVHGLAKSWIRLSNWTTAGVSRGSFCHILVARTQSYDMPKGKRV